MRVGVAHHLGWAVTVTATEDHIVTERRRIELIAPGLPNAPIHHVGGPHPMHQPPEHLDDDALAALVAKVRASVVTTASQGLDELAVAAPDPIQSISLAAWPADFPDDIAVQRRVPYESRADSVMYRQVLADLATDRGWTVHRYDPKTVEADAARILAARAHEVLHGPRTAMGPPWSKDHRTALAATIMASGAV
jgi:hypothetical protein